MADFWCGFWILHLSLISIAKRELAKSGETPELQEWTDRLSFDPPRRIIGRRLSLLGVVTCLEVAEHLPPYSSMELIN